jgi:hypothetical protein
MRSPRRLPLTLVAAASVLAILHACHDTPDPTGPSLAATVVRKTLTVKGNGGTGNGVVTSTPAGIHCTITAGVAAATGCKAQFKKGVVVKLTAVPQAGHTFKTWANACTGTGTCQVSMTVNRTVAARFLKRGTSPLAATGRWETSFISPVVGIHVSLLPTGSVLLWGREGEPQLWNPANPGAGFVQVTAPYELFCSGHNFLSDGRLMVTGGHSMGTSGIPRTAIFDPATATWTITGSMAQGRYYPTTTVLPDGEVLAVAGSDENRNDVSIPEIGNGSTWRRLTTAGLAIPTPYYPAMFVAPNGKVFLAGFPQTSRYLDVSGTGTWTTVADRQVADRTMGSAVMYSPGKVLYVGGGDPPTSSAEVIDLNDPSPSWHSVSGMTFARRQLNATILADGQVLVTHGTSGAGFNDVASAIRAAELWNPATEAWSIMASEASARTYHSAALLLPDARVLASGSGEGPNVSYENSNFTAQVFTPPYLFNPDGTLAARPTIASAPTSISYNQLFTVESPEAGTVSRGTLIRLSSVTHAFNQSQLIYPLTFSATGPTSLASVGPASANLAPPGPYMLFLVNASGVPSVATMVTVGP